MPWHHKRRTPTAVAALGAKTFEIFPAGFASGVSQLDRNLTINGVTVAPTFVYYGGDASASNLTAQVGETLTAQGSGGTFNAGSPLVGADDDSFNPDGTRYYQASGSAFADVTTEDMVFEAIYRHTSSAGTNAFVSHFVATGGNSGWLFYVTGTNLFFQIRSSGTTADINRGSLVDGAWYHVLVFVDRSGSGIAYANNVSGSPVSVASVGTITIAQELRVGGAQFLGTPDSPIAYAAMWQQDNWLDTHLQPTLVQERFQKLTGYYPTKAKGAKLWTSYTRATTAIAENDEVTGSELLPSTDPTSGWTATRASVAVASGVTHPEGATVYELIEDGTAASSHFIFETAPALPGGTEYEFTLDVLPANRDWFRSLFSSGGSGWPVSVSAWFDTGSGINGTSGTLYNFQTIDAIGGGWYRCRTRAVQQLTGDARPLINIGAGDGVFSFDGLNQVSIYIANLSMKEIANRWYTTGVGWPRVIRRAGLTGGQTEQSGANWIQDSSALDAASWTKTRATVTANTTVTPLGTTAMDTLSEDGTAADTHLAGTTFTSAAGAFYTYSVLVKPINRDFVALEMTSTTDGSAIVWFDVSTGQKGTATNVDDSGIRPAGDGRFRCWIRDTRATAETVTCNVYAADADNSISFNGLSQDSLAVWGAQLEYTDFVPTSLFETSGGIGTRFSDIMYFEDAANVPDIGKWTIGAEVLLRNETTTRNRTPITLNISGSNTERITLYVSGSGTPTMQLRTGGATTMQPAGGGDASDGGNTKLVTTIEEDDGRLYVGGAQVAQDTNGAVSVGLNRIYIGSLENSNQCTGLFRAISISKKITPP